MATRAEVEAKQRGLGGLIKANRGGSRERELAQELKELIDSGARHESKFHETAEALDPANVDMQWCPGCRKVVLARRYAALHSDDKGLELLTELITAEDDRNRRSKVLERVREQEAPDT